MESGPGKLLEAFAAKHGFSVEEVEDVFQEELLEHDEKECKMPACLSEFRRSEKKPSKAYQIGDSKRRKRVENGVLFPCVSLPK